MKNHYEKIEAYFSGAMDEKEKAMFEKEVAEDPELKKAAIKRSMGISPTVEIISSVRAKAGPLEPPTTGWKDQTRFFFYDRSKVLRAAAIALLVIGTPVAFLSLSIPSNEYLVENSFISPDIGDTAGTQQEDPGLKQKAADIYGGISPEGLAGLKQLAGTGDSFNIANFYLAHWYLRDQSFDLALAEFDKCISHRQVLDRFDTGYFEHAKFNRILANLGKRAPRKELLRELDTFIAEFPRNSRAGVLHKELNRPVRRLCGK